MTEIKKTPIPQRLKNVSADHPYVAGAVDIVDDVDGRSQQVINADTYRKDETYSKEQLNNMITTPEQEYLSVTATSETTDVDDIATLIATKYPDGKESADTVYRVGCWDGEQYDTGVYTEYVWDGTQYIPVDVKNPGIDENPTAGSVNLVESGGVNKAIKGEVLLFETTASIESDERTVIGRNNGAQLKKGDMIHVHTNGIGTVVMDIQINITDENDDTDYIYTSSEDFYFRLNSDYEKINVAMAEGFFIASGDVTVSCSKVAAIDDMDERIADVFDGNSALDMQIAVPSSLSGNTLYYFYGIGFPLYAGETLVIEATGIGTVVGSLSALGYGNLIKDSKTEIYITEDTVLNNIYTPTDRILSAGTISLKVYKKAILDEFKDKNIEENVQIITPEVTFTDGHINYLTGVFTSYTTTKCSSPIQVKKNDVIRITGDSPATNLTSFAWVIEDGVAYDVIAKWPASTKVVTCEYKVPQDGSIAFCCDKNNSLRCIILRGFGDSIETNTDNILGVDIANALVSNGNLFNPYRSIDKRRLGEEGEITETSGWWMTGYIDVSNTDYIVMSTYCSIAAGYNGSFQYVSDLTVSSNRRIVEIPSGVKYIRIGFHSSYDNRWTFRVGVYGQREIQNGGVLIDPSKLRMKDEGLLDKDSLIDFAAPYIFGTKVSDSAFNDENGDAVTLNTDSIYVDVGEDAKPQYRYNGTSLYQVGCYDRNALAFTSNFSVRAFTNKEYNGENIIIRNKSRYFLEPDNDTAEFTFGLDTVTREKVPYVRLYAISGTSATFGYMMSSPFYTVGKKAVYETKEWRTIPNQAIHFGYLVSIFVPEGVTLFISQFSSYQSDKKGFEPSLKFYSRNENTPDLCYANFYTREKLGFKYLTVIPKLTSDNVWVLFHDDDTIGNTLVNEDLTAIEDAQAIGNYTFEELQQYIIKTGSAWSANSLAFKERVPTLDEFFLFCAKTGCHPAFSIHPNYTAAQWATIKALADKYHVTDRLVIKGTIASLATTAAVFGNSVEGYTLFVNSQEAYDSCIGDINNLVETYGLTVSICIEFFVGWGSAEKVNEVIDAGYNAGIAYTTGIQEQCSDDYWIENGVTEFTGHHTSVGLNW